MNIIVLANRDLASNLALRLNMEVSRGSLNQVEDDPELRRSVFARLRPNAVEWWGVLVVIELEGAAP